MGKHSKDNKPPREPASQCPTCGTWRTPGESHRPNDTQADEKSATYTGLCYD